MSYGKIGPFDGDEAYWEADEARGYLRALQDIEDLVREFGIEGSGNGPDSIPKEAVFEIIKILREG